MPNLPYSTSKATPAKAQQRIRDTLMKFGVDMISFGEDFSKFEVVVSFKYQDYPVCIPVNYHDLAQLYIDEDPYNYRKRGTREDWEAKKREVAYRATYSLLDDFLKSLITIVELGAFSFEEIFVSYFVNKDGQRLGEMLKANLPALIKGQLALTEG